VACEVSMSEKVRPQHLQREAILYIRQSSPHQVLQNPDSQKLQYAMRERLRQLGWNEKQRWVRDRRSSGGTGRWKCPLDLG